MGTREIKKASTSGDSFGGDRDDKKSMDGRPDPAQGFVRLKVCTDRDVVHCLGVFFSPQPKFVDVPADGAERDVLLANDRLVVTEA